MKNRVIMHIDMDAFFASVEQRVDPRLLGRPVAVTGSQKRTVITTASYEARAFGVKTGMTKGEAKRLCPWLIFVQANNRRYTDTCTRLVELYKHYSPLVEVYSVDEVFMDVTGIAGLSNGAISMATEIRHRIKDAFGLTCSIGMAPNKLLAKLASDMKKPNGLVVIRDHREAGKILKDLPVGDIAGIGPRLEKNLGDMGIKTCGELAGVHVRTLKNRFGVVGEKLHLMARGLDDSPVVPVWQEPDAKSVGHSRTLPRDVYNPEILERHILQLSEMVGRRLRRGQYAGRTVTLTIRYRDFHTFSRRKTVTEHVSDGFEVCHLAVSILKSFRLKKAVRLVGVSVSNLAAVDQLPLLKKDRVRRDLIRALDTINDRYGEFTVARGRLLAPVNGNGHSNGNGNGSGTNGHGVISPAWRPNGVKRVEF